MRGISSHPVLPVVLLVVPLIGCYKMGKPHTLIAGVITGQICDRATGNPVPWGFVDPRGANGVASHTDSLGKFQWIAPQRLDVDDSLEVIFSANGYHDLRKYYPVLQGVIVANDTILLERDSS